MQVLAFAMLHSYRPDVRARASRLLYTPLKVVFVNGLTSDEHITVKGGYGNTEVLRLSEESIGLHDSYKSFAQWPHHMP